jgi:hypothetical protein
MANLKKREIIILAIAALFVLYAIYVYIIADRLPGNKVQTGTDSAKIETITSGMVDDLNKSKLSDFDNDTIKRVGIDWGKSPFLDRDLYRAWLAKDGAGAAASLKLIYSGYLESGKSKMAIINNVEYRVDEELIEDGYVLKHIMPLKVIIYDKRTGSNLEIPIQE